MQKTDESDRLDAQIAVVTGGGKGIGRTVCELLSTRGAKVVVADLSIDHARETAAAIGESRGTPICTDVSSEESVIELFTSVFRQFGHLDILVCNAGIFGSSPIIDTSAAEWDKILSVNLRGTFLAAREALKIMQPQRRGKIITMASTAGKTGGACSQAAYAASKAGIISLTKSLAKESAPYRINVNAVAPGPTNTDLTAAWDTETKAAMLKAIPWNEFALPEDTAEAVAFLASARARYITGEILDVNGGMVMD